MRQWFPWKNSVISAATFYNWKGKYGGMDSSQLKKLKEMEAVHIKEQQRIEMEMEQEQEEAEAQREIERQQKGRTKRWK